MNIENDSCFIRYIKDCDGEFAFLTHYIIVNENGCSDETFTIDHEDIYYEKAGHAGFDSDDINTGTHITMQQYLQWEKQIKQAKETAVKMLQQAARTINHDLEVGDFIIHLEKGHIGEGYHDDGAFWGMRIVEIKGDRLFTQCVFIGKHGFNSCDEIYESDESIQNIQNNSHFITAESFLATHNYMRIFCQQLLNDIKSQALTIEQI